MVGTLYVVGVPAGDYEDLTLRARRILTEVPRIFAEEVAGARALLAHHGIATPLVGLAEEAAAVEELTTGDRALVVYGWPGEAGCRLVSAAAEGGHEVATVPGPALPITALVLSGLPADAFLYLGELPADGAARRCRALAASGEQRTLVMLASPPLGEVMSELYNVLGDRPMAVMPASISEGGAVWRGSLGRSVGEEVGWPEAGLYALVVGGAQQERARWDEQRLVAEVEARLAQGQGAKEISRQLGAKSGWSRRQVYDLVVARTQVSK
jgi:16S rRNA (cytidine1402-2'-O)-methyltransferase